MNNNNYSNSNLLIYMQCCRYFLPVILCTLTCEQLLSFWLVTKEAKVHVNLFYRIVSYRKSIEESKTFTARRRIVSRMNYNQGYSGAGTWWSIIPANSFESERRSGKYCFFFTARTLILHRSGKSARTVSKFLYARNLTNCFSGKSLNLLPPDVIF